MKPTMPEQAQVQEFHAVGGHMVGDYAKPGLPPWEYARWAPFSALRQMADEIKDTGDGSVQALRARLMIEELGEVIEALEKGDVTALADGLADLQYVLLGTAVSAGIDLGPVFAEVQRANMAKFPVCEPCAGRGWIMRQTGSWARETCETCTGTGRIVLRDAGGKTIKPPGWTPPDIASVLARQKA